MKKIIYYYNRKYPEYDLEKVPVNDEQFIINKKYKYLDGVYANYNIDCKQSSKTEYFISLYSPYEDKEIYVHDTTLGNKLVFSYNKELILQWRNEDIENTIHKLKKRITNLESQV